MNPILSRLLTGITGSIVGGILNVLIGFILYQAFKPVKSPNMLGEPIYYGFLFPLIGLFLGFLIGVFVGAFQFRFIFSVVVGTSVAFLLFAVFFIFAGGNDLNYWDGQKRVLIIFGAILIDGFLVSSLVSLVCNELLKKVFQKNEI
jgi:hypothetical protein